MSISHYRVTEPSQDACHLKLVLHQEIFRGVLIFSGVLKIIELLHHRAFFLVIPCSALFLVMMCSAEREVERLEACIDLCGAPAVRPMLPDPCLCLNNVFPLIICNIIRSDDTNIAAD
jgi:hypothetical protein